MRPQVFHRPTMLAKSTESDITCYRNVRPTHRWDGRRNKSAFGREDIPASAIARFHAKYQKTPSCWLWTAGRYRNGYGMFCVERRYKAPQINTQAHRVAYVLAHGDIPQGAVVMHSCDVRACVNPAHLSIGDQGDNVRDGVQKGHYSGSRPSIQKITDAQVVEIRASQESSVALAKRYGVKLTTISLIRRGLRRKAA
jgi:hypothetical protein